ncbi:hypothetical protein HDN1F_03500 [gamma proteobacterium HdN1]|nr:hypothetical protein HDN1F_03500 [gamma proteobacterium HdN1]
MLSRPNLMKSIVCLVILNLAAPSFVHLSVYKPSAPLRGAGEALEAGKEGAKRLVLLDEQKALYRTLSESPAGMRQLASARATVGQEGYLSEACYKLGPFSDGALMRSVQLALDDRNAEWRQIGASSMLTDRDAQGTKGRYADQKKGDGDLEKLSVPDLQREQWLLLKDGGRPREGRLARMASLNMTNQAIISCKIFAQSEIIP